MAYNKQYVSLDRIIENVYRDSGEDSVDWEAAMEWTAALIRIIGVPASYVSKYTNNQDNNPPFIEIQNYRGNLPNDIVVRGECRRVALNDNGVASRFAAMVESTDVFFETESAVDIKNPVFFDPYLETVAIDDDGNSKDVIVTQESVNFGVGNTYTYKIEGDIIFTQFETGYVEMAYKGFMTDTKGLPMIPDDEKFINAIKWEIIANMDRIKWRKNPSPQNKSVFNYSEQQRDWYVGAARTKAHIPTVDEMESIKRMWLRSIPKINEHATNFKTLNAPEVRYNQNR